MYAEGDHGWILDAHLCSERKDMIVWIVPEEGPVFSYQEQWNPSLHVSGLVSDLEMLIEWLQQPEIKMKFGILNHLFEHKRLELGLVDQTRVLTVEVKGHTSLKQLAQHIEERGQHVRFTLYSVDLQPEQSYLTSKRLSIGSSVMIENQQLVAMEQEVKRRSLRCCRFEIKFCKNKGFADSSTVISSVSIGECDAEGKRFGRSFMIHSHHPSFAKKLGQCLRELDPDVIFTQDGNTLALPALMTHVKKTEQTLKLGRNTSVLRQIGVSRTVHSYGQVLRSDPQFSFEGRIHIDFSSSFMFKEGGLSGLYELAVVSATRISDAARKSPGSVISAIQNRVAMEDGVLVPWKKTRPEDTKSAWDLLQSDRGGLYLDSKPGVYSNVIELDFASLFPSIIATRNISPETLNCSCCQPASNTAPLPLHPESAKKKFQLHERQWQSASLAFPRYSSTAFQVPGLSTHTCGRIHGFLGRVVAPLIERRKQLKKQVKQKKDLADRQQNALKWLLVTCFGYTGYRNARFGRIEAHEAICAWARELLLQTIEHAQQSGWEVLHAIVDSVWVRDVQGRTYEQQHKDALDLAQEVQAFTGIPLEYEATYDCIAFLPSRVHSGGSLTKYWAYGKDGMKIRGLELRQHSTCQWIRNLQQQALQILSRATDLTDSLPSYSVQRTVQNLLLSELERLQNGMITIGDLLIAQRISREPTEGSVQSLAMLAFQRHQAHGFPLSLGSKARFLVRKKDVKNPLFRVLLSEECSNLNDTAKHVDLGYYRQQAIRAIWAILTPFGWEESQLTEVGVVRLDQWM
jgi:DNA polymerase I